MTANFMLYFAFYVLTPLLPLYLSERFGTTKDMIGIVLSGYTVAALIFRPFSGYIVDCFSRKKEVGERKKSMFFKLFYNWHGEGRVLQGDGLKKEKVETENEKTEKKNKESQKLTGKNLSRYLLSRQWFERRRQKKKRGREIKNRKIQTM